jgi:hypothetical protein
MVSGEWVASLVGSSIFCQDEKANTNSYKPPTINLSLILSFVVCSLGFPQAGQKGSGENLFTYM